MFENYYVRSVTIDRIRGSWIAPAIEQYVGWLAQQRFTSRSVLHRVPILVSFGEFAKAHGASELGHLPAHVEPFVEVRIRQRAGGKSSARRKKSGQEVRNPIRQMLRLAIPGYIGLVRPHKPDNPFEQQAPRFLTHLAEEKGLRPRSMLHYRYHLHQFATYLQRIGIDDHRLMQFAIELCDDGGHVVAATKSRPAGHDGRPLGRVVAQRIVAQEARGDADRDMRARGEARQIVLVRVRQLEAEHVFGKIGDRADA